MNENTKVSFARRYKVALQHHLSGGSSHSTLSEARSLGLEASETGMDAADLVRIHDLATSNDTAQEDDAETLGHAESSPVGAFLLESLTTLIESRTVTEKLANAAKHEAELLLRDEIAQKNEILENSRRLEEQARHLAHQILLAQEEERMEISRELHDEVAQILAGINVKLAAMREGGEINFQNFELSIQQTQLMIAESVEAVHRFAKKLRPAVLDDLGLIPALRSLMKDLQSQCDLKIHLETTSEVEKLNKGRYTILYRVVSEALMNVVRHAEAHKVTVRLMTIAGGIRLEVQDDGKSFDVKQTFLSQHCKRLGLLGMKERVEMVGGFFSIRSEPGEGTLVTADVPFVSDFKWIGDHE